MDMADVMREHWSTIAEVLQELDAYGGQRDRVKDAFKAVCWCWVQSNACARAFEEKVMAFAPTLFQRCARPQGLADAIMRYQLESWPAEWAAEEKMRLEDDGR